MPDWSARRLEFSSSADSAGGSSAWMTLLSRDNKRGKRGGRVRVRVVESEEW